MPRFTRAERLALILLLGLVLMTAAARWWKTRQAGARNQESLPIATDPTPRSPDPELSKP